MSTPPKIQSLELVVGKKSLQLPHANMTLFDARESIQHIEHSHADRVDVHRVAHLLTLNASRLCRDQKLLKLPKRIRGYFVVLTCGAEAILKEELGMDGLD